MVPVTGCLDPTPPVIPGLETSPAYQSRGLRDIEHAANKPNADSGALTTFGGAQRAAAHDFAQASRLSAEPPVLDLGLAAFNSTPRSQDGNVAGRSLRDATAGRNDQPSSFALSASHARSLPVRDVGSVASSNAPRSQLFTLSNSASSSKL